MNKYTAEKPTITEGEYQRLIDERGQIWTLGYRCGFLEAGGQIAPDPEPTNAEKLADIYRSWYGGDEVPNSLIQFMDAAGVTAPEEK